MYMSHWTAGKDARVARCARAEIDAEVGIFILSRFACLVPDQSHRIEKQAAELAKVYNLQVPS